MAPCCRRYFRKTFTLMKICAFRNQIDKSTSVNVMAWRRDATSYYLNQNWRRCMTPFGVTRSQSVKLLALPSVVHWSLNKGTHAEAWGPKMTHLRRQLNCGSLRCSWSIACRRCSNYILILDLTPGFNGSGKDNCKPRRGSFKFWDLVRLVR